VRRRSIRALHGDVVLAGERRQYCGLVGDGCGGVMDCGGCSGAQTCAATASRTSAASPDSGGCTRLSCNQMYGKYCGVVGDGCGGQMDCGACGADKRAAARAPRRVRFGADSGACNTVSCVQATGKYCGVVGDGCGGQMDCGGCGAGQTAAAASRSVRRDARNLHADHLRAGERQVLRRRR